MKRRLMVLIVILMLAFVPVMTASASWKVPTFQIDEVEMGVSVTITTHDFPANDTFNVTMGKMGTRGVGGVMVATQNSGAGDSFTATYMIPESLKDNRLIAIRLESPTSGYYSYNWFYNNTTGSGGVPPAPTPAPTFVVPTFKIDAVVRNDTVTITTANFPADDTFVVTMGYMGTRGVNGVVVGNQDSGAGGTFTETYSIPDKLKGLYQISIRLESPTSGYYSFNWFYNNSTP